MRLLRAIWGLLFKPPSDIERLVSEWLAYEQQWRARYRQELHSGRRRALRDELREQRALFHARKLELEEGIPVLLWREGHERPTGVGNVVKVP